MTRWLPLALLALVLGRGDPAHGGAPEPAERREQPAGPAGIPPTVVSVDEHVRVPVPRDMTLEQRSLGPRGEVLIATDGSDVVIVTVYRQSALGKPPGAGAALEAHAAELAASLGKSERRTAKLRLLGRDADAVAFGLTFGGVAREAWVVAAEAPGRTIVVTGLVVRGSPNEVALMAILSGIRVT